MWDTISNLSWVLSYIRSGVADPVNQPGPPIPASHGVGASQPAAVTGHRFAQPAAPGSAPRGFMPVPNPNFALRPVCLNLLISKVLGLCLCSSRHVYNLTILVSTPTSLHKLLCDNYELHNLKYAYMQVSLCVPFLTAELKPVITTLTRLYDETSVALGGSHANPSKKREIEDNSRRIGSLFAKLNSGHTSPDVAAKLVQLCQALDAGDYAGALHIQVDLLLEIVSASERTIFIHTL
ncbi:hypothetical protein BHE74_00025223 [Ensete ventricosum]|nr:hypothetical protein BHE74_00025223 [Ensete ventricosum]RZR89849.1 hypothetical protein BHM03_00017639 [Ensete ventricosum]